ncbi:DUF4278 domain-containing protein [Geminocystis sp. GBBB08]|uniref:DUF4278 domain-containing protein n=1 Tax=Geminocystis sp. GBBB08 TaxID=2604140 RepID=UPI0027E274B8|nr:DUF4278 domain-containing protein [Geminocystis sp. GBBB08]MBL1210725.1 DUF4278 domain-containing protein [Geminocystis sp. GBBB08]
MEMKYRGIQYQSETSLLETKESDIIGKYRGSQWNYKLPKHIPQLRPKFGLNYRGVSYSTCPNATNVMVNSESTVIAIAPHSRISNPVKESNLEELHLHNLRENLKRRIKIAKETQNDYLLEMLKRESQQLAMNY